ncbi:hypothetical protein [Planctomycetes bacterium K23_9]
MTRLLKMQPTFTLDLSQKPVDVIAEVREAINTPQLQGLAESAGNCIDLKVDRSERRFWSPHLSVQISESDSGSHLYCRFSPRPEIWTMFMAIYAVMSTCIFGSLIWAYVQWFMGDRPWALIIAPIGVLIIAALHIASLVGQSLSADQMQNLRQRLDLTLEHVRKNAPGTKQK